MKITNLFYTALTGVFLLMLFACNKGKDDFLYKGDMLPVTIKGYNSDTRELEIKLDTLSFSNPIPAGPFDLSGAYIFPENRNRVKLSVTEKGTGKIVLEKELKKEDGPAKISFFYMNGKAGDMPEVPKLEEGKIKVRYMFKPTLTHYTEPVDIVLGKYYWTPKVFEELATIKNARPYEFSDAVDISTFSTVGQQYNGQNTPVLFVVYIYKAGTKEFYTDKLGYTWHATSSTAPKPASTVASAKLYIFSEFATGGSIRFNKDLEL
jgi:hypothetical protein